MRILKRLRQLGANIPDARDTKTVAIDFRLRPDGAPADTLSPHLEDFFNLDAVHRTSISEQVVQFSWHNAVGASPKGTLDCVETWLEDFRQDLGRFDIPTLVMHGVADRILPISATAHRVPELVKESKVVEIAFGPHAITWTHAEIVNRELLAFLGESHRKSQVA